MVDILNSVQFNEPQLSVTPGQSIVFYDEDKVLGGGIIEKKSETDNKLSRDL